MGERYSRIAVFPENQYTTGSPIIIVAGVLLKDRKTDSVLVQLKFQNISSSIIEGVKIRIQATDTFGLPLEGCDEYQYLDFSAKTNDTFGQDKAIKIPDKNTRQCNLIVTEVIFNDKSCWKNTAMAVYQPIPKQITLTDALKNNDLVEQYKRETTPSAKYRPATHSDLWLCSCGKINKRESAVCQQCKVELRTLTAMANIHTLEQHKREYDDKIHKETRKKRRIALILTVFLLIIGLVYYIITGVILPNQAYNSAMTLLEENSFDEAIAAFSELGDYKDSAKMVIVSEERKEEHNKKTIYDSAIQYMQDEMYDQAISQFSKIPEYQDSVEKAEECESIKENIRLEGIYQKGISALNNRAFEMAIDTFYSILDYKDSEEQYYFSRYSLAGSLVEQKRFDSAIQIYQELNDYKDSVEKIEQAKSLRREYIYVLLDEGKYNEARVLYYELEDHSAAPLTAEDFILAEGEDKDIIASIHNHGTNSRWITYLKETDGDTPMEDIMETARGIHLGDTDIEVMMAYGETDASSSFGTNCKLYDEAEQRVKEHMKNVCKKYMTYKFGDYTMHFLFDENNIFTFFAVGYKNNVTSKYFSAYNY